MALDVIEMVQVAIIVWIATEADRRLGTPVDLEEAVAEDSEDAEEEEDQESARR